MKRSTLFAAFVLAGSAALSACGSSDEPAEEAKPAERLVAEGGKLVLPAVSSRPAAVYFDITYNSGGAPIMESASVEGAEKTQIHATDMKNGTAMMGEAAPISMLARQTIKFEPGGYHLMVMDPAESWKAGDSTNVTIKLDNGEETTFPVEIQAAGDER
ncbi:MAG: copper chaperone PCu(A)C [Altererythrobacter sp.]